MDKLIAMKARAWDRLTRKISSINISKEFDKYDDPEELRLKAIDNAINKALFKGRYNSMPRYGRSK